MKSIQEYKQEMAKKYEQEAYKAYESVSGKKLRRNQDGSYPPQGRNDDLDAFRHAYVSAAVAQDSTAFIAKIVGDDVENKGDARGQPPKERNMDDWNNAKGREIGSSTDTRAEMKEAVWEALNNGDLIIDLKDQRKYQSNYEKRASKINELWNRFKNWVLPRRDPLALDLDGDGLKTGTGWVHSDDGLLVLG